MYKNVIYLFVVIASFSCETEKSNNNVTHRMDDQGVVIATPYIWKTSLHHKKPASNGNLKFPIIYNDNILIPITNGEEGNFLALINTDDGKVLWRWRDLFSVTEYAEVTYYHQYKNLFTFQNGGRSYCINMDNGQTHWKIMRDRSFDSRINPFGQNYFMFGPISNNSDKVHEDITSFKGDIQSGTISEFLYPDFNYEFTDSWRGINFINQIPSNENLFVVSYFEDLEDYVKQPYFGLYDNNVKEWIWDKILITPPKRSNVIDWPPIIENNKIFAVVDNCIVCHDLETGRQLWKREFTNNFLFSGFILEENRLIANNEDCFTVCLDPDTGNELWRVKTAGTSGRMSYLNGIVYFNGGSVNKLFAIEVNTGKIVWQINPKLIEEDYWAQFKSYNAAQFMYNAVYVIPAKDGQSSKVIALTGVYAYCFEAYR